MKRRTFIKGAVAAAVAAALPATAGATEYTHQTYALATPGMDGQRMAAALARSMEQTKERVAAHVFNAAFDWKRYPYEGLLRKHGQFVKDSGEGARRSVGVEGSPDRI